MSSRGFAVRLIAGAAAAALAGCSSAQDFTDVGGGVRISGELQRSLLHREVATLSLSLSDAQTGYPIDASQIEVRTDDGRTVAAKRTQLGTYSATISDSDKIDVLVFARNQTQLISLKQR